MTREALKQIASLSLRIGLVAVFLSLVWSVPYLFTVIGFSALVFFGHLVTIDDDFPGGWSNPDGTEPLHFGELAIKGVIFLALCLLALCSPFLRGLGGAP